MNLAGILTESAQRDPAHVALKLDATEVSYAMLDEAASEGSGAATADPAIPMPAVLRNSRRFILLFMAFPLLDCRRKETR